MGFWFQDHLALMMELLGMMPKKVNLRNTVFGYLSVSFQEKNCTFLTDFFYVDCIRQRPCAGFLQPTG